MNSPRIGWIGAGKMGLPMCTQLLKAGYNLTVYNRNAAKADPLISAGAQLADTPGGLLTAADILFIMVTDDQATENVFNGPGGLLSAAASPKLIINMSSVSPGISRSVAPACKDRGHSYLDAPVSGSVRQAEDAQLVIMVGGAEPDVENARPVLEKLGKLVLRVGETGAGNTAKLAINMLLSFHAQGLAEAAVFARQHGVLLENLFTLINNSALGNTFMRLKGEAIVQKNFQAAFALKHIVKDLGLARKEGPSTPLAEAAYKTFALAEPRFGEEDIIAVIKMIGTIS